MQNWQRKEKIIVRHHTWKSGAYFNMPIHWAYVHILQPQLCMGKSMAVQVIHLNFINDITLQILQLSNSNCALITAKIKHTPIKRSLINIRIRRNCRLTAGPPTVSSPTLLTDSSSNTRVASRVGSQSDCWSQCLKEKLPWYYSKILQLSKRIRVNILFLLQNFHMIVSSLQEQMNFNGT